MPIIARARLRNLFTGCVLVFLAISAYTFHSPHLAPITAGLSTRAEGVSIAEIEPSNPGWCSVDDIVHGHWVESAPIESIEELQQKFFHTVSSRSIHERTPTHWMLIDGIACTVTFSCSTTAECGATPSKSSLTRRTRKRCTNEPCRSPVRLSYPERNAWSGRRRGGI
jgi:hypothetical protein